MHRIILNLEIYYFRKHVMEVLIKINTDAASLLAIWGMTEFCHSLYEHSNIPPLCNLLIISLKNKTISEKSEYTL